MAITRRMQAGIETGDLSEFSGTVGTAPTASTTTPKTGTYKLLCNPNGQSQVYYTIPATRQIRTGFYWNPASFTSATEINMFTIKDSGGNTLLSIQATGSSGSNSLIIDVAGVNQDTEAGASAGSSFMHIGVDLKVDSSAGWVKVYKDGVLILTFEGNTGNADIVNIYYGPSVNVGGSPYNWDYDDIYCDDTAGESFAVVPIKRFQFAIANGNGNYSQWTGSDGNSTDNYLLVDERPNTGDTDYVQASGVDFIDSYANAGYTLGVNEACIALIPTVVCRRNGTTEQIALGTRTSAGDSVGSDQDTSTSYVVKFERQTTKPGGGAWDQTAIDDAEVLLKSRGTY